MTLVPELEKEQKMPFLSNYERRAQVKDRQEGSVQASRTAVLDALEARFERRPASLRKESQEFEDATLLRDLHRRAVTAASLDEFSRSLNRAKQAV